MLNIVKKLEELDFPALMEVYIEGNEEKAADYGAGGLLRAEQEFFEYLQEDFFKHAGAFYAVWRVEGRYISALRLEPYQDGWLLEALETAPNQRQKGYAVQLIQAAQQMLEQQGSVRIYSHVSKKNFPSLKTHFHCKFEIYRDYAAYIDGSVNDRAYTLRYEKNCFRI